MTIAKKLLKPNATEDEIEDAIIALAKLQGWRVHHQRPGQSKGGKWASQIKGHVGFPDLVLVHPRRKLVLFVELKRTPKSPYRPGQEEWADDLQHAGANYHLWTSVEWFDGTVDSFLIGPA